MSHVVGDTRVEKQAIANAWSGVSNCENCGIRHLALFADLEHTDFELIHKPILEVKKRQEIVFMVKVMKGSFYILCAVVLLN